MNKHSKDFLERLLATISPSGYEKEAAETWLDEAKKITPHVKHDLLGNSYMTINKGGYPRILLTGHYDEIGFIITNIDDRGFINIMPIGGWDYQVAIGQRVIILGKKRKVPGVIGKIAVHLQPQEAKEKSLKISEIWVDIGSASKEETEKLVSIGDAMVLDQEFKELENGCFVSRGIDNKVGAFIILEVGRILSKMDIKPEVHLIATSQEEIGCRGVQTAAYAIDAQIGIATDVMFALDHPNTGDNIAKMGLSKIGGGAIIARDPNIHPRLFELMTTVADKKKIQYQINASGSITRTDASKIQVSRNGMITGLVYIPNRYMHSPSELCAYDDLDSCITLISETIATITPETDFNILKF